MRHTRVYYHAGVLDPDSGDILWSEHTHTRRRDAIREARRMATSGTPVVEYWDAAHGPFPGDCDAVIDCEEV